MKSKIFIFEASVEDANRTVDFSKQNKEEQFPIGLLYLDAVLKKNNYNVLTKYYTPFTEREFLEDIKKELRKFNPDFVGISMMSMTRVSSYKAMKLIKKINPKIKIILGGVHASFMYKQLLENFPVEAVCIGEGEDTILELIDALAKGKSLAKIKGIAYKKSDKVILTEQRPLRMNLDELPYPSYDIFVNSGVRIVRMFTSRGCPNRCTFCCINRTNKHVWRARDYMKVVDEIEFIKKTYPWVEKIHFLDDNMTLDNQRVINMCKELIKRKIKLKFDGQGRIKPISREMIYWMEKAGFNSLYFGVESGSEKILKSCNKNITKEEIIKTWNLCKEFPKIQIEKCIMVGLPGETEETVNETIEFIKRIQKIKKSSTNFYASPLWVFPGTEVYQIAKDKGVITDDYWLTDKPVPFYTVEHSEKWLMQMSNKILMKAMISQGWLFFVNKLIGKVKVNPKHYLKRFLGITSDRKLETPNLTKI